MTVLIFDIVSSQLLWCFTTSERKNSSVRCVTRTCRILEHIKSCDEFILVEYVRTRTFRFLYYIIRYIRQIL